MQLWEKTNEMEGRNDTKIKLSLRKKPNHPNQKPSPYPLCSKTEDLCQDMSFVQTDIKLSLCTAWVIPEAQKHFQSNDGGNTRMEETLKS